MTTSQNDSACLFRVLRGSQAAAPTLSTTIHVSSVTSGFRLFDLQ